MNPTATTPITPIMDEQAERSALARSIAAQEDVRLVACSSISCARQLRQISAHNCSRLMTNGLQSASIPSALQRKPHNKNLPVSAGR